MHRLVPGFILTQIASGNLAGKIQAASLFVDITGFSAVTDALLPYGQHGSEVLAGVMRETLEPLVNYVYEQGGFISSFGGDGFLALFPVHDSAQSACYGAITSAWHIRQWIMANSDHSTPYGRFAFTAKLGSAFGEVSWGIVRSADESRAAFYFKGQAIQNCTEAGLHARPGDIILDSMLFAQVESLAAAEDTDGFHRLFFIKGQLKPAQLPTLVEPDEELLSQFFPTELVQGSTSGEFRQVATLFVNLPTVRTETQLAIFMGSVFNLQARYGGLLAHLDFGDKGSVLFLFWGAPIAHENDVERALNFILDLQLKTSIPIKAGITFRVAHTGYIGAPLREEYTAYGWGVNLAARLMTTAPRDEIWVDQHVARREKERFAFELEGKLSFKGFSDQQAVYTLVEKLERDSFYYEGALVGREDELRKMADFISPIFNGRFAGMLVIKGDPGIGKSRLIHEFQNSDLDQTADILWAVCQTDEILRESFNPFRYWMARTWNISETQSESRNKRSFNRRLEMLITTTDDPELAAELDRTRSFLGALVGLRWPDSLYEQVESQQRYENTYKGLFTTIKALSLQQPVILLLEDIHWLDPDSKMFLARMNHALARNDGRTYPIAIMATTRTEGAEFLENGFNFELVNLQPLNRSGLAELAEAQLGGPAGQPLLEVLEQRAEGNPFFAEQLLRNLREQEMLRQAKGRWTLARDGILTLPDNVRALLVARLDRLAKEVKTVVQTAAVLGREFEFWLLNEMVDNDPELLKKVKAAEQAGIWSAFTGSRFIFRHALLRDSAYHMQLRSRRQALHAKAFQTLERNPGGRQIKSEDDGQADNLKASLNYSELAYHAEQAGLFEEACNTLQMAGDAARESYQNSQALDYYSRAIAATEQLGLAPSWQLLQHRGQVFDVLGDFDAALADYEAALSKARAEDENHAAWQILLDLSLLWASRDYQRTGEYCREALELARKLKDDTAVAHSLNRLANWHLNNGRLEEAIDQHKEALALFETLEDSPGMAATLDLLGQTYILIGDNINAETSYRSAIAISRKLKNHQTLISSQTNSSLLHLDLDLIQEAINHARQIGWQSGETYATIMKGTVYTQLGQIKEARDNLLSGLALAETIGHQQWQGWAQLYLALMYLELLNIEKAQPLVEKVLLLARNINSTFLEAAAAGSSVQIALMKSEFDKVESLMQTYPENTIYNFFGTTDALRLGFTLARGEDLEAIEIVERIKPRKDSEGSESDLFNFGRLRLFRLSSEALIKGQRLTEAEHLLSRAAVIVQKQNLRIEEWRLQRSFGLLYKAGSRTEEAARAFQNARDAAFFLAERIPEETVRDTFLSNALALIDQDVPMFI